MWKKSLDSTRNRTMNRDVRESFQRKRDWRKLSLLYSRKSLMLRKSSERSRKPTNGGRLWLALERADRSRWAAESSISSSSEIGNLEAQTTPVSNNSNRKRWKMSWVWTLPVRNDHQPRKLWKWIHQARSVDLMLCPCESKDLCLWETLLTRRKSHRSSIKYLRKSAASVRLCRPRLNPVTLKAPSRRTLWVMPTCPSHPVLPSKRWLNWLRLPYSLPHPNMWSISNLESRNSIRTRRRACESTPRRACAESAQKNTMSLILRRTI